MSDRFLPDWQQLSLEQQIAQLLVVRTSGAYFDSQIAYPQYEAPRDRLQHWISDLGVGGVILLGGNAAEVALRCQKLQEWATIPLLIAADIEEGVGQRFAGAVQFPPPLALSAIASQDPDRAQQLARSFGEITAAEAIAIGLNWILAPIVDINNNPANPVINVRAFGEDPETVSQLTTAFIAGAQQFPVLTTAKHFPGHGDTATDSHLELPQIPHSRLRLETVELQPFRQAIAAGVDAVMTAHLSIPALDPDYPATLSPTVLQGLLRQDLGFEGLIVTDALVMQAIAAHYGPGEAARLAFEAGADILLMPADPEAAIQEIAEAICEGQIRYDRLEESLARIWRAKQKVCGARPTSFLPHAWEQEPAIAIDLKAVSQPKHWAIAAEILTVSQEHQGQPLAPQSGINLIVGDRLLQATYLSGAAPARQLPSQQGLRLQIWDTETGAIPTLTEPTLVQWFIRGNPFRGSAGADQVVETLLKQLLEQDQLLGLVIYGSPYIWQQWRSQLSTELPAIFSFGQTTQAQAIALQQLFHIGKQQEATEFTN
ncbi:glycoside hydrolase family 3 protein [Synechococcus elongatus]|uniref:glycoside hydrolase family 3 protein n=1 Tax=Synechococcus elongatus TaxID=32046 RepID=UPI0030D3F329